MASLLAKPLPRGVRKEIIIIESNSRDGTRDQVKEIAGHKDVHVIYQSQHAARATRCARGYPKPPEISSSFRMRILNMT